MATRSRIAIENSDKSVSSIYCHSDGYPEGVGQKLMSFYQDRNKVEELIALGDLSYLEARTAPTPGVPHSFDGERERGVTVAYHRDRGEDLPSPRLDAGLAAFNESDVEEYGYVYTLEGDWYMVDGHRDIRNLTPLSELL
jgi:hypothetical protein